MASTSTYNLYAPGTTVYVVNAATFGIAIAQVSAVDVGVSTIYTVVYANTARATANVAAANVYPDAATAITAYTLLIS